MLVCTLFNEQDKGSNLPSIITWSVLEKKKVQAVLLDTILCQLFDPTLDKNLEYLMAKNVANSWSLVSFMASSYSAEVPS